MIRDILVHVDATSAGRERLNYAFDLAEAHGARLTGVHVIRPADVPPTFKPSLIERAAAYMEMRAEDEARASEALFELAAQARATETRWRRLEGRMAHRLCEQARCSDLVLLGQYESEGSASHRPLYLADVVALEAGRPTIVVPEQVRDTSRLRRALVGWDHGRECARALHDALPLLLKAGARVEILTLGKPLDRDVGHELVEHLQRHGLVVDANRQKPVHGSTGASLVDELEAGAFDLLIMGAYGRPPWIEFLFGGATKTALVHAKTPVFVCH